MAVFVCSHNSSFFYVRYFLTQQDLKSEINIPLARCLSTERSPCSYNSASLHQNKSIYIWKCLYILVTLATNTPFLQLNAPWYEIKLCTAQLTTLDLNLTITIPHMPHTLSSINKMLSCFSAPEKKNKSLPSLISFSLCHENPPSTFCLLEITQSYTSMMQTILGLLAFTLLWLVQTYRVVLHTLWR